MDPLRPTYLRTEYKAGPLGIDTSKPRLSWVLEGEGRGRRQTAYEVLVASTRDKLDAEEGDLWTSGRVETDQQAHVVYNGAPLTSRMTCWWKVRVWDEAGQQGAWSLESFWTMGLLEDSDWEAQWIGYDAPLPPDVRKMEPMGVDGCSWVSPYPATTADYARGILWSFRKTFDLPGRPAASARVVLCSDDDMVVYLNGKRVGRGDEGMDAWHRCTQFDLTSLLTPGANVLAVACCFQHTPAPALIGRLVIRLASGEEVVIPVDESWKVAEHPEGEWWAHELDDSSWSSPTMIGAAGDMPWGPITPGPRDNPPCPYLRKSFSTERPIERATVYASALGLFELRLNGEKVGEDCFTPGWTDYKTRVYYLTYDVTEQIRAGDNVLGLALGHGWYSGFLGWVTMERGHYGKHPRALVQLELEYADGTRERVVTDASWRASHGPIVGADLYLGAEYDARRALPGWDAPGFDDADWQPVVTDADAAPPLLQSYPGLPVQAVMELSAVNHTEPKPGVHIFDMGQNMVGWARLRVRGAAGTKVQLRFAEMLKPDGTLYVTNLRSARSVDEYTLRGEGEEIWEPPFTFHGFRYVEVTGYPGAPGMDTITGVVVHSNLPKTGWFECSDAMLNQLQHNIVWGQRGNFLEVPTDCPQRDERLGWMGDAQVFARTACFNMDSAAFFTKWLQDVEDAQSHEGAFSNVSPRVVDPADGAPAWADAGVIVPWTMYLAYGDTGVLARHYDAMVKWIEFVNRANPDHLWLNKVSYNFGDWLSIGEETPKEVISTAYFAYSTRIVSEAAHVLGHEEDAAHYHALRHAIRKAFNDAYVDAEGHVHGQTQTCYALALEFDLLPEPLRKRAAEHLVANVQNRGTKLTTGFVGCPLLLFALSNNGAWDTAYTLLQSKEFPSWGYSVAHGATTIWERWDGWTQEKGFQNPGMNSFNHYAFGAVGNWMYQNIAGIDLDPEDPGYKHLIVSPHPGGTLTHAQARYDSLHGRIATAWRLDGTAFTLDVEVPVNTRATVTLPTSDPDSVRESGDDPADAEGLMFIGVENDRCVYTVNSGQYHFVCGSAQVTKTK